MLHKIIHKMKVTTVWLIWATIVFFSGRLLIPYLMNDPSTIGGIIVVSIALYILVGSVGLALFFTEVIGIYRDKADEDRTYLLNATSHQLKSMW